MVTCRDELRRSPKPGNYPLINDPIVQVISNILEERPTNAADIVENVSQKVKSRQLPSASAVADSPAGSEAVAAAAVRSKLFEKPEAEDDLDDDDMTPAVADVVGTSKLFGDAGRHAWAGAHALYSDLTPVGLCISQVSVLVKRNRSESCLLSRSLQRITQLPMCTFGARFLALRRTTSSRSVSTRKAKSLR